jgi:hypothetical protein
MNPIFPVSLPTTLHSSVQHSYTNSFFHIHLRRMMNENYRNARFPRGNRSHVYSGNKTRVQRSSSERSLRLSILQRRECLRVAPTSFKLTADLYENSARCRAAVSSLSVSRHLFVQSNFGKNSTVTFREGK